MRTNDKSTNKAKTYSQSTDKTINMKLDKNNCLVPVPQLTVAQPGPIGRLDRFWEL